MRCGQKERDTFPTTYAKDYVWHNNNNSSSLPSASNFDAFALTADENKAFIDLNAIREIPWEEQLKIIKKLHAQRMKTTYYVSYCKVGNNKELRSEGNIADNDTLLTVADRMYSTSPRVQKVLAPIPTARRVMGYCRPAYYYTGLSEYQDEVSRAGYNQLVPFRNNRLKQQLPFCSQFQSKH